MSEKFCVKLVSIIAVLFLLSVGNGYASWDNYWHSQCDSRWANTKMGNSTPSDDTIGKYGCALTCVAILHQVEKNGSSSDVTPATLNTWLTNTSGGYAYDKDGYALINWGKAADMDGLGGLSYYGSDDTWDNWLYLDDQLSAGRKVIVKVDFTPTTSDIVQHWVLVVEKNGSSAQPSSYKILDPWPTSYESRTLAYYYDANYDNTFFSSRTYSGTWDVNSTPQNNTLIRANGDTKVYWLQDNVRYHVASEAIAQAQTDAGIPGWTWPTVNVYDASKINQYTEGPEFIANNINSDGLLIRQTGTNSVYVMIDGKRRWICSNEALDW
ncbi:MAG: hypothetical protein PF495_05370, partial [Spirochaetales bacterium]|nr:hypothetical protein [Spirochaetales bacterium]